MKPTDDKGKPSLEQVSKAANEAIVLLYRDMLEHLGTGPLYECAAGCIAATALVHAFRLGIKRSPEKAKEILQSILDDVALNIKTLNDLDFKFTVEIK